MSSYIQRSDFATMAIVTPSRGRPENIAEMQRALSDTFTTSPLWVVCDDDDPTLEQYMEIAENLMVFPRESKGMARPLNLGVQKLLREQWFTHFAFLGDDHRPRTIRWDQMWIDILQDRGGIVYGDDLFQHENLPTAVGMEGAICAHLGGMVPTGLIHLYLDNFWKQLGEDLDRLFYLPDCIIEHMHPLIGKAEVDEGYIRVNAPEIYDADRIRFTEYMGSGEYQGLLEGLRAGLR
jgi:hypothetical protein